MAQLAADASSNGTASRKAPRRGHNFENVIVW